MARTRSAGVVLYRHRGAHLEVLLVHPGGPFWSKKDDGAWSIPKGEFGENEAPATAARREFAEETGYAPAGELTPLTPVSQAGGKIVHAFAVEGDVDPTSVVSNTFTLEWPPRSGRMQAFPEIDRAGWFGLDEARRKIVAGQRPIVDEMRARFAGSSAP
jgi:predicted NUDIX family NTP pyrophosphohydrolase